MFGRPRYSDPVPGGYPPGAEPFLAAVVADRADDTVRLAFADWLDENNDPERAEFIRTQIELYRRQPDYEDVEVRRTTFGPEGHALYECQRSLLARNRTVWLTGFPRWALSVLWQSFRRGFPTAVHASADQWLEHGERLRRWVPLEEVSIEGGPTGYAHVVAGKSLTGLNRLVLRRVGTEELRALADSPALDTVNALELRGRQRPGPVEAPVLRAFFGSPRLKSIRELRVWLDRAGDTLGFVLGGSPHLRNLQVLEVSDAMRHEAARELFDSSNMANVTQLELPNDPMGDVAIRGLVRSKYVTRLTRLVLRYAELTAESGHLLGNWPGLRTITSLDLDGNRLGIEGLRALAESAHMGQLRSLLLNGNVSRNQVAAIRSLPGFAHIPGLRIDW